MRALADRAGTSVSAAQYHFGGKRGIMRALVERRLDPINARRASAVDAFDRTCEARPPALEEVLAAYLRPSFDAWLAAESDRPGGAPNIEARLHTDPHALLGELKDALCKPVADRYVDVLVRVLPEQDRQQLSVGLALVSGLLVHVLGGQIVRDAVSADALFDRLVAFSAAGILSGARVARAQSHRAEVA